MRTRALSLLLALCVVLASLPVSAFAAEGGFSIEDGVLLKYEGEGGDVKIPDGVTEIAEYAFANCTAMTSVTIPGSVTSIQKGAFQYCGGLTSVTIPSSVTDMDTGVFTNCRALTSVTILPGLTGIGDYTFMNCESLTSVVIHDSVTSIGKSAFASCRAMTSVTIPSSVTSVMRSAFDSCEGLTDVYYAGTAEQWAAIDIDEKFGGNDYLLKAKIHYGSSMPEIPGEAPDETPKIAFTDVPGWAKEAVAWAVAEGVTNGTSADKFSTNTVCRMEHILTFLYRAKDEPPVSAANPFTDVKESDYFYKAAVWAASQGLVTGTALNYRDPCTRATVVTYLWKLAGSPAASYDGRFTDVSADAAYAQAVAWAVDQGVTEGTGGTSFSPDASCTRGQIVTFLYRTYGK